MNTIGAQLYTVRALLDTEAGIRSTLTAIRELGYTSAQLFGSGELLQRCAAGCREAGLKICGLLADLDICEREEAAIFALCETYNIPDIGISTNAEECRMPDNVIRRANAFAAKAAARGFTFSYHNHGHEFIRDAEGVTPMERFLRGFDAATVRFMPDTYWLHDGGFDVRHFLELTEGRVDILHLKDLKRTREGHTFAEVGCGNLWFAGILKTAQDCGITQFVVEQDRCDGAPLDSLAISLRAIRALGLR